MPAWARSCLALILILFTAGPALAEWIVFEKPDTTYGGTRTTLAGQTTQGGEVHIICNGENRSLNFLFPDGITLKDGQELRVSFLTDNGQVWAGPARVYVAKGGFFALGYENKTDLEGIVADLIAARTELVITIEDTASGMVAIYTASAKGSTAAGKAFQTACFGGAPAPPPATIQAEAPSEPARMEAPGASSTTDVWTKYDYTQPDGTASYVLIGDNARRDGTLFIACSANGAVSVAYESNTNEGPTGDPIGTRMTLIVTVDDNVHELPSEVVDNGNSQRMVLHNGQGFGALMLVGALRTSPARISVTVSNPSGVSYEREFEVANVLAEADELAGSCFPGNGSAEAAPAPAPAPQPAAAGSDWVYEQRAEGSTGGPLASVAGDLDQGGYLAAYCLGPSHPALAFLSTRPETFPYEDGDVGLSIHLEIDGQDHMSVGEYFRRADGVQGIVYTNSSFLETIFGRLANASSSVAVQIESYSNGITTRWPARSLNGLRAAIGSLQQKCFGPISGADAPPANAWEVTQYISDIEAGYRAVLTARTVRGDGYMRMTCSLDAGTWTLGIYADRAGDLGIAPGRHALRVSLDDLHWDLPAGRYETLGEGAGVVASDETVDELLTVLSLDKKMLFVEVVGEGRYQLVSEGSVAAGLKMFSTCFALN